MYVHICPLAEASDSYAKYTYDKNNRVLTQTTYKVGQSGARAYSIYSYYDSGLLKSKRNYVSTTTSLANHVDTYDLTYHADGNIATVENDYKVTSYAYDNAGRLTSESLEGVVQASYTYDAFGNRAAMVNSHGTTTYTYDKNNRMTYERTTSADGTVLSYIYYDYDDTGNLVEKYYYYGDAMTHDYDLFGRLVNSASMRTNVNYTYDGNGIRLSKTSVGVTTNFINDGGYVVGEVCGDNIIKYTYGNNLISINNNGTLGFYHTDEHGNVSAISDTNKNVVADYDFDAFGNETVSTDTYYNPMRYCGEYYDTETDLIYLRARYYDPSVGRFISEDPHWNLDNMIYGDKEYEEDEIKQPDIQAISQASNLYVYCLNNPIAFIDFSGLDVIVVNQTENVAGFGHMSAFVEDDNGNWYFFYWGSSSVSLTKVDDNTILYSEDKMNDWLIKKNLNTKDDPKYDAFCYIYGDFSETKDYYQKLTNQFKTDVKNGDIGWFGFTNKNYNLFTNNCTQATMKGLYLGTCSESIYGGKSLKNYYTSHGYSIGVIPNENLENLQNLFISVLL